MKTNKFFLIVVLFMLFSGIVFSAGQSEEQTEKEEMIQLEVFRWDAGDGAKYYEEAFSTFEEQNPGVEVVLTQVPWGEYVDSLTRFMMADTLPDVFAVYDGNIGTLKAMEALLPLDQYVNDDFRSQFFETHWNNAVVDGKTYGIVFRNQVVMLFYNKDLFREAGLSEELIENGPRTYTEVIKAAKACTTEEHYGVSLTFGDEEGYHYFRNLVQAANDNILNLDDYSPNMNSKRSIEALEFMTKLMELDVVPPGAMTKSSVMSHEEFANGLTAIAIGGMQIGEDYWRAAGKQFELGVAPIPHPDDMEKSMGGGAGFVAHSVASNTDHPELAVKLAKHLGNYDFVHQFCKERGLIPTRKDVVENEPYWSKGNQPVYLESTLAPNFRPLPAHPRVSDLTKIVRNAIEYAIMGEKSEEEALDDAASEWAEINKD